jgi:hypothetical protein
MTCKGCIKKLIGAGYCGWTCPQAGSRCRCFYLHPGTTWYSKTSTSYRVKVVHKVNGQVTFRPIAGGEKQVLAILQFEQEFQTEAPTRWDYVRLDD